MDRKSFITLGPEQTKQDKKMTKSLNGCNCVMHLCSYEAKLSNLKLKTQTKQLSGSARQISHSPILDIILSFDNVQKFNEYRPP